MMLLLTDFHSASLTDNSRIIHSDSLSAGRKTYFPRKLLLVRVR